MPSAVYSPCSNYRYTLYRDTGLVGPTVCFIMANPSTATDEQDDATIRKVQGFARVNGWGHILIGNIFALRSTDIKGLGRVEEPIGTDNDIHLQQLMATADITVFAWGNNSKFPREHQERWRDVLTLAQELNVQPYCIGRVSSGHPRHPLMTRYGTPVSPWSAWNIK